MCLTASTSKVLIADRDIPCYKIVSNNGRLFSSIRRFNYELGKLYRKFWFPSSIRKGECFYEQGFHSFREHKTIHHLVHDNIVGLGMVSVECHIPMGSKYILGDNMEYLSEDIVIDEIITTKRYKEIIIEEKENVQLKRRMAIKKKKNDKGKAKNKTTKLRRYSPTHRPWV